MKNLNEYKIITDQQFEEWKSNWNPKEPIPQEIHEYMNNVVLAKLCADLKQWTSTF